MTALPYYHAFKRVVFNENSSLLPSPFFYRPVNLRTNIRERNVSSKIELIELTN